MDDPCAPKIIHHRPLGRITQKFKHHYHHHIHKTTCVKTTVLGFADLLSLSKPTIAKLTTLSVLGITGTTTIAEGYYYFGYTPTYDNVTLVCEKYKHNKCTKPVITNVPEPSSVLILGTLLVVMFILRYKQKVI